MDTAAFEQELTKAGFQVNTVSRKANEFVDTHTHSFEAKALILSGQISINVQGKDTLYPPGSVFHLHAGTPHTEQYGPEGVTYLVGRKEMPV
jgi:quercetin dioxygenase-like cupin family protein